MRRGRISFGTVSERSGAGNCLAPKSRSCKPALVRLACVSLADLTRLWLLRAANEEALPSTPTSVPLTARYRVHETTDGWRLSAEMGEPSPPPEFRVEAAAWREVLSRLAALRPGEQLAVCAPTSLLERAAREALALPAFALDADARNVVIDWPARSAAHLRCAFIGLDLDWAPPPPPKTVARFPGGPGAAATSRT